jgi:pimeloyl-ACP methyl ester carboxylesterase
MPFCKTIVYTYLVKQRYYGKSLPYGESTFTPGHMGFLTAEQALADYAVLISRLRTQYSISKVISFGGSYGGMLSAWFRFKYPNSVDGALAASAPIYLVANLTSPYTFFGLVTQVGVLLLESHRLTSKALNSVLHREHISCQTWTS